MTFNVYVAHDQNGRALYVGQTGNLTRRMREHESLAPWWYAEAAFYSVIPCETREEALEVEGDRITALRPAGNANLTAGYRRTVREANELQQVMAINAHEEPPFPELLTTADRKWLALRDLREGITA